MNEAGRELPKTLIVLGYAGLAPQALALLIIVSGSDWRWVAAACAFAYAALIFSFLGGVWWGGAMRAHERRAWPFVAAVLPSLIALALYFPWTIGWDWPAPALMALGLMLAASPLVDRALGYGPPSWLRLRRNLSFGLGLLTFLVGILV